MKNIIKNIKNLSIFGRRKKKKRGTLFLKRNETSSFYKKRKNIKIKNNHLDKLKLLGTSAKNYYIFLFILFICGIIYILVGPFFKVKSINIIKQGNLTNMIISYKSVENYRGKSIWKIKDSQILKSLQNYQHNIKSIKTDIELPNSLKIIINSYEGIFNTTINDKTYIITENGTLIPSMYSEEYNELQIINKFDKNKFLDYKKILDNKYLYQISEIHSLLKENVINLKILNIKYYKIERELHIETDKNTLIIFDLQGNIKEQIKKYAIFNKEHLDINNIPTVYIDLRIKNKVFYCTDENKSKCINNLKSIYPNG